MKTYGKFEALKELYQTPTGSVWSARPVRTGGAATCCIKVIGGETAMFGPVDAGAVRSFLAGAAAQQKIAADADAWAPIYDYGAAPGESEGASSAYYVTKLYPRSAQRLIDTRAHISAAELRAILQGVVRGLRELRAAANRPHGNLKPANVLLAERLRGVASVALTDPDPNNQPVASLTKLPDVKALGALLFSLVTGKPYMTARWPVPMSSEWARLGSSGPLWLQLCNNLLNTRGAADEISLEMIGARVDAIRPTRRKLARRWVALAAVAVIGVCGYLERAKILPYLHREQMAQWPHIAATELAALDQAAFSILDPPKHSHVSPPHPAAASPPATLPATQPLAKAPPRPAIALAAPPPPVKPPAPVIRPPVVVTPPPPPAPNPDIAARARWIASVQAQQPPDALPPAAKAAFEQMRGNFLARLPQSHDSLDAQQQQWAQTLARVEQLDSLFPVVPAPDAQQQWQLKVAEIASQQREQAMAAAVATSRTANANSSANYKRLINDVQRLFIAGGAVDQSLAAGDVPADGGAGAVAALSSDPALAQAAAPLADELQQLSAVQHADNRQALLAGVDDRRAIPGVRVAAWQRLDKPAFAARSLADVAAEREAGLALADALDALGNPTAKTRVANATRHRVQTFFDGLTDPSAVASAVAADSATPPPLPAAFCPSWFQYDLVLSRLQHRPQSPAPADVDELTVLAANVDEPSARRLAAALATPVSPQPGPVAFDHAGPGAVGWTLRSHRGQFPYASVVYLPPVRDESQDQAIEFLRVPSQNGSPCYLCTTDVSVAMLQQALGSDVQRVRAFRSLGPADSGNAGNPGAHVWTYSGDGDGIVLDEASYRSYFQRAPSAALPAQFVTPQMAMYVARMLGCRLPSAAEWHAALASAAASSDASEHGFALHGWKLRDTLFQQMARHNAATESPPLDDGVFDAGGSGIWSPAAVKKLGGLGGDTLASMPDTLSFDGADELGNNASAAFRPVGDFPGVFHDLIGNVAEFVMDGSPPADQPAIGPAAVRNWFTAARLGQVRVVGGSALSPPSVDPLQPLPLPAGGKTAFADVGFRLAFTDPTVPHNPLGDAIASARLITAATVNTKPAGVANTP